MRSTLKTDAILTFRLKERQALKKNEEKISQKRMHNKKDIFARKMLQNQKCMCVTRPLIENCGYNVIRYFQRTHKT